MHWLTTFDPADGELSGSPCDCSIGDDHDDAGNIMYPLFPLTDQEDERPQ